MSFKTIELSQDIPEKKGYLELLGLATFEKKGQTWFMVLQHEALVPVLGFQRDEGLEVSIPNFSHTSKPLEQTVAHRLTKAMHSQSEPSTTSTHKQTTTNRVRENLSLEKQYPNGLTDEKEEESQILNAKPGEEPDRAKVKWNPR